MSLFLLIALALQSDIKCELFTLLEQAKPTYSKKTRLAAFEKLRSVGGKVPKRTAASLAPYARDPDPEIREQALHAIGAATALRAPCPLCIIQALTDPDKNVRLAASTYDDLYEDYPEESIPLLFDAVKSKHTQVRSSIPFTLMNAAGDTPDVRKAIRLLCDDPDLMVRGNAHSAHFKLTGDLDYYVPNLLRITADRKKTKKPQTEEEKRQKELRDVHAIGGAIQLYEQSRLRPNDLAKALSANLAQSDAAIRQCALRHLRAMCISSKETHRAVDKLNLDEKLAKIAEQDKSEEVQIWADWVRDLIKEGPPEPAPEKLKPLEFLGRPATTKDE